MQNLEKYKKAFGIKTPLSVFPPKELKRRWRILCQKYHPDKGGSEKHFLFIQKAYEELKKYCKGEEKEFDTSFTSEVNCGIGEIIVKLNNGGYGYIWDIEKTHGVNLNKCY